LNSVLYNILRARAVSESFVRLFDFEFIEIFQKLADKIYTFYQSHNQLGRLFSDWSTTEDKLGDSLQRTGHFLDSFSGQIEEYLHEEDALMDFLKHQASYCDVIKSVVEKHEQLNEDNAKQETTLGLKRTQRDAYVIKIDLNIKTKESFFVI